MRQQTKEEKRKKKNKLNIDTKYIVQVITKTFVEPSKAIASEMTMSFSAFANALDMRAEYVSHISLALTSTQTTH